MEETVLQLLVRELNQKLVGALKLHAAAHGCGAKVEHHEGLRVTLLGQPPERPLKEVFAEMPYFDDDDLFGVR
jgi:plasmid stability protein